MPICRPRTLTAAQAERALRRSVEANPANADTVARVVRSEPGRRGGAKRLVLSVGHRWPESGIELAVQFLDDPPATLRRARRIAMDAGLRYVYGGNVHDVEGDTTWCPGCGAALITRDWYRILDYRLTADARCPRCGLCIAGHFAQAAGDFGPRRIPVRIADF